MASRVLALRAGWLTRSQQQQTRRWLSGTALWQQQEPSLAGAPDDADKTAHIPEVWGCVHSVESFTALDGPGVRFLVFLQGCGLRCEFCSNPDTWEYKGGQLTSSKELAKRLDRVLPYLKSKARGESGITLSGGEAMLQPEFVAALFQEAHARGLTTCIDTAGQGTKEHNWDVVLPHLDYALFCIKSPIREKYARLTRRDYLPKALKFVKELEERKIKYWVRYVLIPGVTDTYEDVAALMYFCKNKPGLQGVEVLPYHTFGKEKWHELGLMYPMEHQRQCMPGELKAFIRQLKEAGVPVLYGSHKEGS